jgi:ATP-dependent DNA helicase RecG
VFGRSVRPGRRRPDPFVNAGLADTLGSGVRNLYRYTRVYSGQEPELIEGDVFTTIIPLGRSMPSDGTEHGIEDVTVTTQKLLDSERSVLEALRSDGSMTIKTLVEATGLSQRQVSRILVSLREYGLLRREGSDRSGKWVVLTSLR